MGLIGDRRLFPCPVCTNPLQVRESKKKKPYLVCDSCGIQIFVRGRAGIDAFNKLVEVAANEDIWTRLANLEERYRKECPKCGRLFWIEEGLIQTSWADGSFRGFRCPQADCEAIVVWWEKS